MFYFNFTILVAFCKFKGFIKVNSRCFNETFVLNQVKSRMKEFFTGNPCGYKSLLTHGTENIDL